MTDRKTLLALAERVEWLTGPDREANEFIAWALGASRVVTEDVLGTYSVVPDYTASLDAAMSLVPEAWEWSLEAEETEMHYPIPSPWTYRAELGDPRLFMKAEAATPALALTAAALRALAETRDA